ncbi:MAG: hypothetical protein OEZ23_03540, partial [Gammaproteobacteria bacterium]|nr:hypothetical protein [Gammaproteobacteria bacterium]
ARAVRELDREMQPERDLWVGIERRIMDHPQHRFGQWRQGWLPYGVAASLMLAMVSLVFSLSPAGGGGFMADTSPQTVSEGIDRIKSEYHQVINPMTREFGEVNKPLGEETLDDLYNNLAIIEKARKDIEAQLRQNPDNPRLVEMLMWIHQKEVELLKRDFAAPIRTI